MHHTLALSLATLCLLLPLYSSLQLHPDAVALLSFKASVDPNNNLPFQSSTSHCLWRGVQCSRNRVTRLVLETLNLTGPVPNRTLATLDQLRVLSLKNNLLSGPIPDLSNLTNLKALFLSHNSFSGPFPPSVLFLHRIRTVDLSRNRLSGRIPASLRSLDRLYCFRVRDNRFDGPVPPLNQSSLKIVDFSGNGLSGPVPVTPVLLGVSAAAFDGNPELCGEIVRRECKDGYFFKNALPWSEATARRGEGGEHLPGSVLPESGSGSAGKVKPRKRRSSLVVGLAVGGAVVVVGIVAFLVVATNKKKMHNHSKMQKGTAAAAAAADAMEMRWTESVVSNGEGKADRRGAGNELVAVAALPDDKVKRLGSSGCLVFCAGEASLYTLEQLMKASAEMLGKGMVGTTYKAVLDNRLIVGVKRLDAAKIVIAGSQNFEQHMENVGRLRHPNLVPLRAYFQAGEERLLVYDYQPNGSLYSLMHGSRSSRAKPLHWTSCLKIAEDVVQGLAYIHQASRLVHGNLKSSNVLLGADFEACLADNCLAFLAEPGDSEDWGHRAPEARNFNGHLTSKSDIYSFGILLLELLTGKPPLQQPSVSPTELSAWVRSVRKDSSGEEDKHLLLLDIVTACMRSLPEQRPTAWQVLKMIQEVKDSDVEESDLDSSSIW